jgi:hypothetical protein
MPVYPGALQWRFYVNRGLIFLQRCVSGRVSLPQTPFLGGSALIVGGLIDVADEDYIGERIHRFKLPPELFLDCPVGAQNP